MAWFCLKAHFQVWKKIKKSSTYFWHFFFFFRSPFADLIKPIAIKPKPEQTITLNAIKNLQDKENKTEDPVLAVKTKSALPLKPPKTEVKTMTLSLNTNSNKSVLRVLNGLSKLLNVEPPKQWMAEDKSGNVKDMFRCKIDNGKWN